ncbi:MAG: hypothetical protein KC535_04390 [Nanoarchaeota archaeon]|nr:hypothetical protein [Nanoarchaeota archaeon]
MGPETMYKESLLLHTQEPIPLRKETYDAFLQEVKNYARLQSQYGLIDPEMIRTGKEKLFSIKESLHQKETWYTKELYRVVDDLEQEVRSASSSWQYRSVLFDCIKVQKVFPFLDLGSHLEEKLENICATCEYGLHQELAEKDNDSSLKRYAGSLKRWLLPISLSSVLFLTTSYAAFAPPTITQSRFLAEKLFPESEAVDSFSQEKSVVPELVLSLDENDKKVVLLPEKRLIPDAIKSMPSGVALYSALSYKTTEWEDSLKSWMVDKLFSQKKKDDKTQEGKSF